MAKLRKNNEYATKINFASVAMLAMLSGAGKEKRNLISSINESWRNFANGGTEGGGALWMA